MIILRKSAVQEEKGLTLLEVMVAVFILAVVLTPMIAYFGRNLNKIAELRNASIALNLAKEGMEKVRSLRFILGSVYVTAPGESSFTDGSTASTAQDLKLRVQQMGSEDLTVNINGGTATGTIVAGATAGAIILCEGVQVADVTSVTITGGSSKDRFDIIYEYPDDQTDDETWRTEYTFVSDTAPLEVQVKVFKESAAKATTELVSLVETL